MQTAASHWLMTRQINNGSRQLSQSQPTETSSVNTNSHMCIPHSVHSSTWQWIWAHSSTRYSRNPVSYPLILFPAHLIVPGPTRISISIWYILFTHTFQIKTFKCITPASWALICTKTIMPTIPLALPLVHFLCQFDHYVLDHMWKIGRCSQLLLLACCYRVVVWNVRRTIMITPHQTSKPRIFLPGTKIGGKHLMLSITCPFLVKITQHRLMCS